MAKKKFDIFISYRRDGGINSAVALHSTLLQMNYRAFLDVNNLQSGKFDDALYDVIDNCTDFLLVLSPRALERCNDKDDWVRKEVERALQMNKNIIPIICDGGDVNELFTNAVPEDMKELLRYNVLKADVVQLQAMTALLRTNLHSRPVAAPQKRLTWVMVGILLCALLAFGGYQLYQHLNIFPKNDQERNLVDEVISDLMYNITAFDQAQAAYISGLKEAENYVRGGGSISKVVVRSKLNQSMDTILYMLNEIQDISPGLVERAAATPMTSADIEVQPLFLRTTMEGTYENLMYLNSFLIEDETTLASDKLKWIQTYQEMGQLEADMVFSMLNSVLFAVNEDALFQLKTDILPDLDIVAKNQMWRTNETDVNSHAKSVINRYEDCVDSLEQMGEQSARILEHEKDLALLRIETKMEILEQKRDELEELRQQLEKAKAEGYERNKPLITDDPPLLWGKAQYFLTLEMYDAAIECFVMYTQVQDNEDFRLCADKATRFIQYMPDTGVTAGIIVMMFEEGKTPQPHVQIGDIIFQVNGTPIRTTDDYFAAIKDDPAAELSILRFSPLVGYEFMDARLDPACSLLGVNDLVKNIETAK